MNKKNQKKLKKDLTKIKIRYRIKEIKQRRKKENEKIKNSKQNKIL